MRLRTFATRAAALEHYAKQAQNTDAERRAAEIRMRAERKAGQLLTKMPKANGARGIGKKVASSATTPLSALGITRNQSSLWQKLGAMPQKDFDYAIGTSVKPPSTKGILRGAAPPPRRIAAPEAIWLWGRLLDFERDGLLDKSPADLIETMTDPMKDDVHRLAPKVAKWLRQIGAMQ